MVSGYAIANPTYKTNDHQRPFAVGRNKALLT